MADPVVDAAGVRLAVECWPKEYQIARAIELAARVLDMTGAEASSQQETCG